MKNAPLLSGIILIATGLIGIMLSQLSVLWMWFLVTLGIAVIIWTVVESKKNKNVKKQ